MNPTKPPGKKKTTTTKKVATKKKGTTTKVSVKKKTAPKKKVASKKKPVKKATPSITNKDRYDMISTMAYYRSEKRDFEPGHSMDDWLECERLVDEMISKA